MGLDHWDLQYPLWSDSAEHDESSHFRSWLQAAVRRIVIYVGFTSSSGHLDAEFPLLKALRTKPGVPWPAAFDPKQKLASEPRLTDNRLKRS